MRTPKIEEPKLPYASRAASFAADSGGSSQASLLTGRTAITRPSVGTQVSNTGRPSLLGGVK